MYEKSKSENKEGQTAKLEVILERLHQIVEVQHTILIFLIYTIPHLHKWISSDLCACAWWWGEGGGLRIT